MEVYGLLKKATLLAKVQDFDGAISLLNEIYNSYDVLDSDVIRVIPYFQKAGRYSEIDKYCLKVLIPLIININERLFSNSSKEVQVAFAYLGISKLYNKLCLCAKREKIEVDQIRYNKGEIECFKQYEHYLSLNDKLGTEFANLVMDDTLGEIEQWPNDIKSKFSFFIGSK